MIATIVKKLNGHAADAASLAEALAQNGRDIPEAEGALRDLQVRRHQALLDDATDAVLNKLDREVSRAEVKIEKLRAAADPLRERLATARAVEHERAVDRHIEILATEYLALRTAVFEAERAQQRMMAARSAAISEVGERGVALMPNLCFAGILGMYGSVEAWAFANDPVVARAKASRENRPITVAATAVAPAIVPKQQAIANARTRAKSLADAERIPVGAAESVGPMEMVVPRAPDFTGELQPGQALVRVVRNGYCPDESAAPASVGQLIAMDAAIAAIAQNNGAVRIQRAGPPAGAEIRMV
jgi:hypothetical protein